MRSIDKKTVLSRVATLSTAALITVIAASPQPSIAQPPQPVQIGERPPTTVEIPSTLTLPQAIDIALRYQPTAFSARANRERAEQTERVAQARYYPTLTPQYSYLNQYSFGTVNQFLGNGIVIPVQQGTTRETKQAQLGASVRLLDNGQRDYNARQARQSLRAQEYAEENARQTVVVNVADTYFNVLRNDALVRVAQAQVERAKNTLDVIEAQVRVGTAAQKDTLQARADYLNAQVNLLNAQNNAAVAQANLKQALGLVGGEALRLAEVAPPTQETPITANIAGLPANAFDVPTDNNDTRALEVLTRAAFVARPDVGQQEQNLEIAKTTVKLSQLNAGLNYTTDLTAAEQIDPNRFDNSIGRNRQVNFSVSYPLFDGFLTRSQVRANQAGVRASEASLAQTRQQVAVEVEQAYRTLVQARAALPAAALAIEAAQINFRAADASRRQGVSSIVEVITAQTSLVQAETNYVQAVFNFYSADARLARAIGQTERIPGIGGTGPVTPGLAAPRKNLP